jgi:hypothetical protein
MKVLFRLIKGKKGVSLIVSYVLLISIAMALSIMVYAWLRFYVEDTDTTKCPDGVDLIIQDYTCLSTGFNLIVKNKGLHSIDGFRLSVHDREDAKFALYVVNDTGVPLSPGISYSKDYLYNDTLDYEGGQIYLESLSLIEVSPFVLEGGEKSYCENEVSSQVVRCIRGSGEEASGKCVSDGDCNDGNDCTVDVCDDNSNCQYVNADGEACYFGICALDVCELVPHSSIISWWKFENNFLDAIGGNTLDPTGSLGYVERKEGNKAIRFNGIDEGVMAMETIQLAGTSFTMTSWVNLAERNQTHSRFPHFFQIGASTSDPASRAFLRFTGNLTETGASQVLVFSLYNASGGSGGGTGYAVTSNKEDWEGDEWYFIAATFDVTSGEEILYINGIEDSRKNTAPTNFLIDTAFQASHAPRMGRGQSTSSYFNGSIDEAMVFGEVLNASEIEKIYLAQKE